MGDPIVTDLEADEANDEEFNPFDAEIGTPLFDDREDGDSIGDTRLKQDASEPPPARGVKPGVPSIDEWMDFFSRIVLRVACDWYIEWSFRGVDETSLNDREIDRIQMTDEERKRIAVPFAELSHKSKFMRRHGRTIVASGGVFDAIVAIGTWTSRVNRIARRHKPTIVTGRVANDGRGQGTPPEDGARYSGANGGRIVDGITVVNPGG